MNPHSCACHLGHIRRGGRDGERKGDPSMKTQGQTINLITALAAILLVSAAGSAAAAARFIISEIVDATGVGAGNALDNSQ
ncbi:MAG: hypothetical protein V3T70_01605, partial [Phycisphaerae bacterium]